MNHRLALLAAPAFAAFACIAPLPGAAAGGVAFDAVSKLSMSDPSTLQPGSFDADFQTAANTKPSTRGGMFGSMMRMGENMSNMMKNGSAERHYVAGTKERIDLLTPQTATILDCTARTLTTLDLKNKTYHVSSLDQPAPSGGSGSSSSDAGPGEKDDGSKVSIAVTNQSLGKKDISGTSTDGYSSDLKVTSTKPSGESDTSDMAMRAYYAGFAYPVVRCNGSALAVAAATRGNGMAAGGPGGVATIMSTLRDAKGNPRFTMTSSGPPLPLENLALWQITTLSGNQTMANNPQAHPFAFLVERGNVRTITDSDPIFTVPSDFTKQ